MLAYRIEVNGQQRLIAGFEDWDTLNVTLFAIRQNVDGALEFQLHIGGGVRQQEEGKLEHVRWAEPELRLGDTITVSLVDVDKVDPPAKRYRSDRTVQEDPFTEEEVEQFERREYQRLRRKFEGMG